jgi:hypothetical protein
MESFILKRCGSHHWGYSYSLYWEVEGNTHLYRREQVTNVITQQGRERKNGTQVNKREEFFHFDFLFECTPLT